MPWNVFETFGTCVSVQSLNVPLSAYTAKICVTDSPIRYRLDGTDPTPSTGMILPEDQSIEIHGYENMKAFRFIRDGILNDAKLDVHYFTNEGNG